MLPKKEFYQDVWPEVYASKQNRSVIMWPVIGVEEHDGTLCLVVGKDRVKGLIPAEETGVKQSENKRVAAGRLAGLIGQEVPLIVLSTDKANNIFIGSRVSAAKKLATNGWERLQPGDVRTAIARRIIKRQHSDGTLTGVGVLVEVEGIEALLPIGELSHGWVGEIENMVQPGESFDVKILEIDRERERLLVSVKALYDNPWPDCVNRYKRQGTYLGTVSKTAHFGVFVSLEPGVDALCNHPKSGGVMNKGDRVAVIITNISPEDRRIKGIISRVLWRS